MNRSLIGRGVIVVAIASLLLAIFFYATRSEVSAFAKSQIRIGTPRSRVLELCGPPTGSRSTENFFDYDEPSIMGWYAISFDENGLVRSVDDESF
jgi:hypothetical protein